jgi:hypothetical protein
MTIYQENQKDRQSSASPHAASNFSTALRVPTYIIKFVLIKVTRVISLELFKRRTIMNPLMILFLNSLLFGGIGSKIFLQFCAFNSLVMFFFYSSFLSTNEKPKIT